MRVVIRLAFKIITKFASLIFLNQRFTSASVINFHVKISFLLTPVPEETYLHKGVEEEIIPTFTINLAGRLYPLTKSNIHIIMSVMINCCHNQNILR